MQRYKQWYRWFFGAGLAVVLVGVAACSPSPENTASEAAEAVEIDADDIGGVVQGPEGPEAGVWVVAETDDLPTLFRRIVVTDDEGRFVVPDLPEAGYRLFVRGYGLVDSDAVDAVPGQHVALMASPAPDEQAAAQYYPANYWFSLLEVPARDEFPLTPAAGVPPAGRGGRGGRGGGAPRTVQTQAHWAATVKGCEICHQMGTSFTRDVQPEMGDFASTMDAWRYRLRIGQSGGRMSGIVAGLGEEHALGLYADWTDRIAAGAVPEAPPRPAGVERNIVLTLWDIATETSFLHDMFGTDKREPTINANGPMIASDFNHGTLWFLDPEQHSVEGVQPTTIDDPQGFNTFSPQIMENPSIYYGEEVTAQERLRSEIQNITADGKAWVMMTFRNPENPDWCRAGSGNPYAENYPLERSGRQIVAVDLETHETTHVDTCFSTHHGAFAEDDNDTMYVAGLALPSAIGWVKTRQFLETGDARASQGWCPAYYDINGNGTYQPEEDELIGGQGYYITVNPVDGSVWWAMPGTPGWIVRMEIGDNPPATCRAQAWQPPFYNPAAPGELGFLPRGIDVDRNGLIWTGLAGSGQLASFDRDACEVTTAPGIFDPQHCPEGWTLYDVPGPNLQGITEHGSADFLYGNWVDQYNTLGLGENVPIAAGTGSDSILALLPETGEWVVMRVPYPMGFFTRSVAGRIDDPGGGWKGRGLWTANQVRNPWHIEGGARTLPQAAKFQVRPDPLAH